ncbi:roadblock/LC7 domain-containing protein [bacterium]|nr:roadblock/LC7 domain-containing protein [bacterium]
MKELLVSLHSVSGVEGTMLCDYDGNVVCHTFSDSVDEDAVSRIAYAFSLGIQGKWGKPQAIYGTFADGRIAVRIIEKGFLIVIGKITMKQLLLKAALDRAISRMEAEKPETKSVSGGERSLQVAAAKIRLDQAVIDSAIFDEWKKLSRKGSIVKQVEIKTHQGKASVFKIKTKKGLGDAIELNSTAIKELELAEGETIKVTPLLEIASEVEEFFG